MRSLVVRSEGCTIEGKEYWVAIDRFDLTAEQIALIYKLRWEIETFFAWWKRHLKVYHLVSRSRHGLMIQILTELTTYLLLAIYCHEEHGEQVSIK
jgi:IS4 transposase